MTAATVEVLTAGPDAHLHRRALSTLQRSFTMVDGHADVVLVSGRDLDGARTDHLSQRRPRAIVVASPGALSDRSLEALCGLEDGATPVVALTSFVPASAADAPIAAVAVVRSLATYPTGGAADALLTQLAAVRHAGPAVDLERVVHDHQRGYAVLTSQEGAPIAGALVGAAVLHRRSAYEVEVAGPEERRTIRASIDGTATPALHVSADANGSRSEFPVHQTPERLAWSRLLTQIEQGRARPFLIDLSDVKSARRLSADRTGLRRAG